MPKFRIEFMRKVTVYDLVERVIEAESAESASDMAEEMAGDFNSDCPDDVKTGDYFECESWGVENVDPADESELGEVEA